ncbi:MAG: response regulator, partial [Nitrospirota bacterium]
EKMKSILIVEDEGIIAKDIAQSVESLGYRVCGFAVSGKAAFEEALRRRPDLVLMDIVLQGGMNGIEAARDIRAVLDVPVVYLTSYSDQETLDQAMDTGPLGYVIKPFRVRELNLALEMALSKHAMERKTRQLQRALRTMSRCGSALLRARTEEDVLKGACASAVESGDYDFSWAGLLEDPRRPASLKVMARAGRADEGLPEAEEEMLSKLFREGAPIVTQEEEPSQAERPCPASRLLLPLSADGGAVGAVCLYASEAEAFGPEELDILTEMANNVSLRIASVRALAERERAEALVRESEAKYKALVELSTDIIYTSDRDGIQTFMNSAALEVLEAGAEEVIGHPWLRWVHPEDREKTKAQFLRMMESGGNVFNFENRFLSKTGRVIHVLHNVSLLKDKDGRVVGTQGIARDITSRKRMEEELRLHQERLAELVDERTEKLLHEMAERKHAEEMEQKLLMRIQTVFENIPLGIVALATDLMVRDANRQFYELTGLTERDVLGVPCHEIIGEFAEEPHGQRAKTACTFCRTDECRKARRVVIFERPFRDRLWRVTTIPEMDEGGDLLGYLEVIEDITERRRMEEELLKTEKLESVGVLAGGIAHDFNNLLTSILSNIALARLTSTADASTTKRMAEAEKAALKARDLTHQLMTFSRGGVPVKKPVRLDDLARDAAGFSLRGSNVRCDFSLPAGLWPVEVDELQISCALSNLIINADQAMPEGGVIILSAENVTADGEGPVPLEAGLYVKVTVADRGAGIEPEHMGKIFDPFFTTKQGGSGLGLATTYSVIKKHGGHISVQSAPGEGTSFQLYLPAAPEAPGGSEEEEHVFQGTGKVLVMDDDEAVRDSAGAALGFFGYDVYFARDGEETVELYARALKSGEKFDAVIMDLTIPGGMGGLETVRELKKLDPGVRAIVSSGYSTNPVMADYESYGFAGVIAKPYRVEDLSRLLNMLISS